jgi:hypothetical protein
MLKEWKLLKENLALIRWQYAVACLFMKIVVAKKRRMSSKGIGKKLCFARCAMLRSVSLASIVEVATNV